MQYIVITLHNLDKATCTAVNVFLSYWHYFNHFNVRESSFVESGVLIELFILVKEEAIPQHKTNEWGCGAGVGLCFPAGSRQ